MPFVSEAIGRVGDGEERFGPTSEVAISLCDPLPFQPPATTSDPPVYSVPVTAKMG